MKAAASPSTTDPFLVARTDLMRVTLGELRTWEAEATRRVIVPKADEEAWEGTELDAARTVL